MIRAEMTTLCLLPDLGLVGSLAELVIKNLFLQVQSGLIREEPAKNQDCLDLMSSIASRSQSHPLL